MRRGPIRMSGGVPRESMPNNEIRSSLMGRDAYKGKPGHIFGHKGFTCLLKH